MYVCMYVQAIAAIPFIKSLNYIFLSKAFLLRTYYQFRISQSAKIQLKNRYFEEQICWVPLTVGTFRMSNSLPTWASLGLMPVGSSTPSWGKPLIGALAHLYTYQWFAPGWWRGRLGRTRENRWLDDVDLPFLSLFALLKLVIRRRKPRKNLFKKQDVV